MATNWYQQTVAEVAHTLDTNITQGLTAAEAARRLEQYSANELIERGGRTRWQILFEQLKDLLTLILIAATVISVFLGDVLDAVVILAIVVLNAALGYSQELRAEQSIAALKQMAVPRVRVRRGGAVQEISARELVPGDLVLLETGNVVPADGHVLQSINLRVQEATLTGESEAVDKSADLVYASEKALADRRNMLYSGTMVNYGHGSMLVTDTGMQTELGKIADMLQSVEQTKTPLQQRLDQLGKVLTVTALGLVTVIFVIGVLGGEPIHEMLLTAVSLAVAAIPEAMTAVVTIALSLGAQRMLKRHALIRKLPAVETLGSVNIICTDKTGTLTQNRMKVTVLDIANRRIDFTQRAADNRLALMVDKAAPGGRRVQATLDLLLVGGALCNDAILARENNEQNSYYTVGDPTEGALVLAAAEYGILKNELDAAFPRIAEYPFDSERKRMTTVHQLSQAAAMASPSLRAVWDRKLVDRVPPFLVVTKGALDGLLTLTQAVWSEGNLHPFDESWRVRVMDAHNQLAQNGMRILGVAVRGLDHAPDAKAVKQLEQALILVGMFGMIDPARPEVYAAIKTCKRAGIRPIMITGDHPLTAHHIATQIGIAENDLCLTGEELDKLSESELKQKAKTVSVFARVSPAHKLRLIHIYQDKTNFVAMTGDGVNDAPALRKADIGVAMGITGTDVSKDAADMVLLDDNFATIVTAIEEGRIVYDNIRKFIKYLLSCNASEIAVMLLGPLLGMPLPLLPLQILWMNLVTDGLPALALGVEPAEANVMARPPYSAQEGIFGRGMGSFIGVMGIVMSLITLSVGLWAYRRGDAAWQTLLFTTLIFAQLALALGVRSEKRSLFQIGFFSNRSMAGGVLLTLVLQLIVIYTPFFQRIFKTTALTFRDLLITVMASLLMLAVVEAWKWVLRRKT